MAEKFSTGLRQFLGQNGSMRQAFADFKIRVFNGTTPADADAAEAGTLLAEITKSGAAVDPTEVSTAKQAHIDITVAALGATVIVAINGTDYTFTVTASEDDLRKVARKVALMLDAVPAVRAMCVGNGGTDGDVVVQSRIPGLSFTIAKGGGGSGGTATWTLTDNTIANSRCDALQFSEAVAGVLSKEGGATWQGLNLAAGQATYFRIVNPDDTGQLSTTQKRIQGVCGSSTGEAIMPSVNLVKDAITTVDSAQITIPAA